MPLAPVTRYQRGARACGAPMAHPWQYKIEDIGNTQEGEKLDINISDIETSARGLRNTWVYTGCVMKKKHIV